MGYRIELSALESDLHTFIGEHFQEFTQWIQQDIEDSPPECYAPEFQAFIMACQGQWPTLEMLTQQVAPAVVDEVVSHYIGSFIETYHPLRYREIADCIRFRHYQTLVKILAPQLPWPLQNCLHYLLYGRRLTQTNAYFNPLQPDIFKVAFWFPSECESLYHQLKNMPPGSSAWQNVRYTPDMKYDEPEWAYECILEALGRRLTHQHILLTAA